MRLERWLRLGIEFQKLGRMLTVSEIIELCDVTRAAAQRMRRALLRLHA